MILTLYAENTSSNLLEGIKNSIREKINSESNDYISSVGESQYIEYLKQEFQLEFPEILWHETYIETSKQNIPGHMFPGGFYVDTHKEYKKDVIHYNIPFQGNIHLLKFKPNNWNTWIGYKVEIDLNEQIIKLEFVKFSDNPEEIKKEFEEAKKYILACYDNLRNEIDVFNEGLENFIKNLVDFRKEEISQNDEFIASLGVPLKPKNNVPKTFKIPKPKLREKIKIKPKTNEAIYNPEPTLDDSNYQHILKIINDIGKNFERLPSVYTEKEEEDLRDHILLILDPNFQYGSASGETFNKTGKTDIQLRYDSSVVFIAECKFWKGEKSFLKTIDQLLKYLTWRDSKTSVIIFVRNKDFSTVLKTVKMIISTHPNFIKFLNQSDESWFNYEFSLPIDKNKEIKLAVQLYHLPD